MSTLSLWRARAFLRFAVLIVALAMMNRAAAHTGSTAYLQAEAQGAQVTLRADYALRDLEDHIGLDANGDGQVTWGEVKAATPAVLAYLSTRLLVTGDGAACELVAAPVPEMIEHSDGPYAVFSFSGECAKAPREWALTSTALFEFDANHRAFARWQSGAQQSSTLLTPSRQTLAVGEAGSNASTATFATYWQEGLAHVWSGWDHMLFIAGLFLAAALVRVQGRWQPVPRLGPALLDATKLVTAFTIAHAVTLCLTALGWIALSSRLVESLVALSVLFAGLNNVFPMVTRRGLFALAWLFGLIHGTAIAGALLDLGLPPTGRLLALLGFNLGVEAAQLLLVLILVPIAFALRHWRGYVPAVLWPGSVLVAAAGLVWFVDRAFEMGWPLPI